MSSENLSGVRRALITGGAGFIGSNVVHALVSHGVEVVLLDTMSDRYGANMANLADIESDVRLIQGDVRESDLVSELVEEVDAVFHLAAQLSRPISMSDPHEDLDINGHGTLSVLEAVRQSESVPPVVYASSQAVYGQSEELPATETTTPNPVDIYGTNKLLGEHYCRVYNRVFDVPTVVFRLTNVYGPRAQLDNPNYGVINRFLRLAIEDQELPVYEPGEMVRHPVFVNDAVRALLAGLHDDTSGEIFVIGGPEWVTIKELASRIIDAAGGGRRELVPWPDEWDSIRVGDIYVDTSKANAELGWSPRTDLETGLERTVDYYRERHSAYI